MIEHEEKRVSFLKGRYPEIEDLFPEKSKKGEEEEWK